MDEQGWIRDERGSPMIKDYPEYLHTLSLVMFILAATVGFLGLGFGLVVIRMNRKIWKNTIFRVLVVVQAINGIRFTLATLITVPHVKGTDAMCRVILFVCGVTTMLPIYLTTFCVVYIQLLVIHQISPSKRRTARISMLTFGVLCSVVPQSTFLFLSHRAMDITSFCYLPLIPTKRQFIAVILSYSIWSLIPGIVGLISMGMTLWYVFRTSRRVSQLLTASSRQTDGMDFELARHSNTVLLNKTMWTVVWFPVAPILAEWFNVVRLPLNYYEHDVDNWREYLAIALACSISFVLGIAIVVNPAVRAVVSERRHRRQREKLEAEASVMASVSVHSMVS